MKQTDATSRHAIATRPCMPQTTKAHLNHVVDSLLADHDDSKLDGQLHKTSVRRAFEAREGVGGREERRVKRNERKISRVREKGGSASLVVANSADGAERTHQESAR